MAIVSDSMGPADFAAITGNNSNNGWNDGTIWIWVLFLFALMGGWNNNSGNGGYPMMGNMVQNGFDQAAIISSINGVTAGINALAQGQCNGFAGVNNNMNIGFANAESSAAARQIAGMQQAFAAQTAIDGRLDALNATQAQYCYENRAAVADLKYAMANEGAATRANTDVKVQAVMDKLCQLEMDNMRQNYENRIAGMQNQIDALRTQVSNDRFDASQNNQTATIQAGQRALANEVEQYVLPTARPAYIVQNPNCCSQQMYYGCGCGA